MKVHLWQAFEELNLLPKELFFAFIIFVFPILFNAKSFIVIFLIPPSFPAPTSQLFLLQLFLFQLVIFIIFKHFISQLVLAIFADFLDIISIVYHIPIFVSHTILIAFNTLLALSEFSLFTFATTQLCTVPVFIFQPFTIIISILSVVEIRLLAII